MVFRRILSGTALAALLAAACWAARLAYADYLAGKAGLENTARAARLAPANARYWLRWADLAEEAGQPSGAAVERALSANPYASDVWIRAGLAAEAAGDYGRAERSLLEAARLSRQYQPRWTLASHYFRRGQAEPFWNWTRSALEWAYGDRTPLFQLAWAMSSDAGFILGRGIPETGPALAAYLSYLWATERPEAAPAVAAKLARIADGRNLRILLDHTTRMLRAGKPEPALETWNSLCARKLLPYSPLGAGKLPTNGDFAQEPLNAGFDWWATLPAGVTFVRNSIPPLARFSFSGKEPEQFEAITQFLPVKPSTPYALRFEYRTEGIAPQTGLRWMVFEGTPGGAEIEADSPQLASDAWKAARTAFAAGSRTRWVRLALAYRRMPGTTRIAGTLSLRNVTLEEGR